MPGRCPVLRNTMTVERPTVSRLNRLFQGAVSAHPPVGAIRFSAKYNRKEPNIVRTWRKLPMAGSRPLIALAIALFTATLLVAIEPVDAIPLGRDLVPREVARRHGLMRAWFRQIELDPTYSQITDWKLDHNEFFVVTNVGLVQGINVNTGEILWVSRIGNPSYPSLGPSVDATRVAVINGSTVYVLNRKTGRVMDEQLIDGAPGAAAALSKRFVFVPLLSGRVIGYPLDASVPFPWFYQSVGHATLPPVVTPDGLIWTTSSGDLYLANASNPEIQYKIKTRGPFAGTPSYFDRSIFAVSTQGKLFAIDESTGAVEWKFMLGYPTQNPAVVIDDMVYSTSDQPALFALERTTGMLAWKSSGIRQFAMATSQHVYGLDFKNRLVTLQKQNGAPLSRLQLDSDIRVVLNDQSDRLLLISNTGTVQCFHELGAVQPTYYGDQPSKAAEDTAEPPADPPTPPPVTAAPQEVEEDPFDGDSGDEPAGDMQEDPFGGFNDQEDDNPFF